MKKRILSIVLAVVMIVTMLPIAVFADGTSSTELETKYLDKDYIGADRYYLTENCNLNLNNHTIGQLWVCDSSSCTMAMDDRSSVKATISGNGIVTNFIVCGGAELTIEGGKFVNLKLHSYGGTDDHPEPLVWAKLSLKGGMFKNNQVSKYDSAEGGVTSTPALSEYVADGYKLVNIEDGEDGYSEGYRYKVVPDVTYEAKIGDTGYATFAKAVEDAKAGQTVEIIKDCACKIPNIEANITIKAADGVNVVFDCTGAASICSIPNGCTFENVTMNFGQSNYHGFQHAGTINMNNCTLNGLFFSYGDMNFTGCTFNAPEKEYSMWLYGDDISFDSCVFKGTGKFFNVYNEGNGAWNISVENCVAINTGAANKAVFNVKETCGAKNLKYDVTLKGTNVAVGNFNAASNSDSLDILNAFVQVDDKRAGGTADGGEIVIKAANDKDGNAPKVVEVTADVYASEEALAKAVASASVLDANLYTTVSSATGVAKIGDGKYETLAEAVTEAKDGDLIEVIGTVTETEVAIADKIVFIKDLPDTVSVDAECEVSATNPATTGVMFGDLEKAVKYVKDKGNTGFTHPEKAGWENNIFFFVKKNIKLTDDIVLPPHGNTNSVLYYDVSRGCTEFELDLNGHKISQQRGGVGGYWWASIDVYDGAKLTINDTSDAKTGEISGIASCIVMDNGGQVILNGGTLWEIGDASYDGNGIVKVRGNSSFTMNGGTVAGASATSLLRAAFEYTNAGAVPAVAINGGYVSALAQANRSANGSGYRSPDGIVWHSSNETMNFVVKGGYYSVDPSAYVANGYMAVATGAADAENGVDINTYKFKVVEAEIEVTEITDTEKAEIAEKATEGVDGENKEVVEDAAADVVEKLTENTEVTKIETNVAEAVETEASAIIARAVKQANDREPGSGNVFTGDTDVKTTTKIEVKLDTIKVDTQSIVSEMTVEQVNFNTVVYDVQAIADVTTVITDGQGNKTTKTERVILTDEDLNGQDINVRLAIPATDAKLAKIIHRSTSYGDEIFYATVQGEGDNQYVDIKMNHFSEVEIQTLTKTAAVEHRIGHQYWSDDKSIGRAIIPLSEEELNAIGDKLVVVGRAGDDISTLEIDSVYSCFYNDEKKITAEEQDCAAFVIIEKDSKGNNISGYGYFRFYNGSADNEDNFLFDALFEKPKEER